MIRSQLGEFMRRMQRNSVAIIPAAREATRSNDTHYRFRQDSDFFYLTGFEEPDAIAVIKAGRDARVRHVCAATRSRARDLGRSPGGCRRR